MIIRLSWVENKPALTQDVVRRPASKLQRSYNSGNMDAFVYFKMATKTAKYAWLFQRRYILTVTGMIR